MKAFDAFSKSSKPSKRVTAAAQNSLTAPKLATIAR